jgi:hypothetical protein
MTIIAPVPIVAGPAVPDSSNAESTFDTQFEAFNAWMKNNLQPGVNAIADATYANALDAQLNAAIAQSSADAAAISAGAIAWVSGSSGSIGDRRSSPLNGRVYRRLTVGAWTTDPSLDATNWVVIVIGFDRVIVTGTTQAAASGSNYWLTNVAATTVTPPAAADGAKFRVTPVNGLLTNAIDFGAATVLGYGGATASGLITMTLGAPMEFEYSTTLTKWVMP